MTDIQQCKSIVLKHFDTMERVSIDDIPSALSGFVSNDYSFRGVHPFNELNGAASVASTVWQPMRRSFTSLQRRQDIFMAAPNLIDGNHWVTSMGKFMGLFDNSWLGIPATGKIAFIPYCEFHRIDHGQIAESALWIDIISVMKQAGLQPLPGQTAAEIINPGPRTSDGLLYEFQDKEESKMTLDLIMEMCANLVGDDMESSTDVLRRTWREDMSWYGPSGIGATHTISRYELQHQRPFTEGLRDIEFNGHVLEHADGNYGAWFGWPNLRMRQGDGFLGLPASDTLAEMRVVDIYRREGDKLAENWVFIDLLHYLRLLGVDVLERCRAINRI